MINRVQRAQEKPKQRPDEEDMHEGACMPPGPSAQHRLATRAWLSMWAHGHDVENHILKVNHQSTDSCAIL